MTLQPNVRRLNDRSRVAVACFTPRGWPALPAQNRCSPSVLTGMVRTTPSSAPSALLVSSEITQLCNGRSRPRHGRCLAERSASVPAMVVNGEDLIVRRAEDGMRAAGIDSKDVSAIWSTPEHRKRCLSDHVDRSRLTSCLNSPRMNVRGSQRRLRVFDRIRGEWDAPPCANCRSAIAFHNVPAPLRAYGTRSSQPGRRGVSQRLRGRSLIDGDDKAIEFECRTQPVRQPQSGCSGFLDRHGATICYQSSW
jgi:hypothetical protein